MSRLLAHAAAHGHEAAIQPGQALRGVTISLLLVLVLVVVVVVVVAVMMMRICVLSV